MKTYLADIIPKIKKYSQKLDNLTLLTNQHWVVIDELENSKFVYIFRSNSELLISQNGKVEKGKWEYLGNNSLLIERKDEIYLFRHGFFDSNILALKVDGKEEYAFLVNENNNGGELNSIEKVMEFLETKYLIILPYIPDKYTLEAGNPRKSNLILDKVINVNRTDYVKYGFLNIDGHIAIDHVYDGAYEFCDGLARVIRSNNNCEYYGFINENGEEVIPLIYEYATCFREGLAVVKIRNKFGYVDSKNTLVISIQFDDANPFINGKAKVRKATKNFFIKPNGEVF